MKLKQAAVVALVLMVVALWWPLILLASFVAHLFVRKKNVIRIGPQLEGRVTLSEAREFDPAWWVCFPGLAGYLQTFCVLFKRAKTQWWDLRTVLVEGDARLGLWWRLGKHGEQVPIVVIFPGLTGDGTSSYALTAIAELQDRYRVCLACPRGCGDSTVGRKRPYNARNALDHLAVLQHVHKKHPTAPVFALAFSLGANLLVNALSDYSSQLSFLSGAVAVGSPWNLMRSATVLESGLSRLLFSESLAGGLVHYYRRNRADLCCFPNCAAPLDERAASVSVRSFDALLTAPAAEYASVEDYYRDASSHGRVDSVRVPLLSVSARDDPVVEAGGMPLTSCSNPHVAFVMAAHGGHLGFVDSSGGLSRCWVDRVAGQFFDQLRSTL